MLWRHPKNNCQVKHSSPVPSGLGHVVPPTGWGTVLELFVFVLWRVSIPCCKSHLLKEGRLFRDRPANFPKWKQMHPEHCHLKLSSREAWSNKSMQHSKQQPRMSSFSWNANFFSCSVPLFPISLCCDIIHGQWLTADYTFWFSIIMLLSAVPFLLIHTI